MINSISEGYLSSINVAKYTKTKSLPYDSVDRFKMVIFKIIN